MLSFMVCQLEKRNFTVNCEAHVSFITASVLIGTTSSTALVATHETRAMGIEVLDSSCHLEKFFRRVFLNLNSNIILR